MGKRGPKRQKGKREANGRLSRKPAERSAKHLEGLDKAEREMIASGLEARQRVWGVPAPVSRDQMAGSAVGRFCLQGLITRSQYDAAMSWLAERQDYHRCILAPRQPGAVDLNATKGLGTGSENVARVRNIVAAAKLTDKAIRDKQLEVGMRGNLWGALDAVLMRDVQMDHLLGDLRTALNALVKRYGLTSGREAA